MTLVRARLLLASLRSTAAPVVDLAKVRADLAALRAEADAVALFRETELAEHAEFGEPIPVEKAALSDRLAGQPIFAALRVPPGSANALYNWTVAQGIPNPVSPGELHLTTVYSRTPVPLFQPWPGDTPREELDPATYRLAVFGEPDDRSLVLVVNSWLAIASHEHAAHLGASWSHPDYQPHITLATPFVGPLPPSGPPPFAIEVGDEFVEALDASGEASAIGKGKGGGRKPGGGKGIPWKGHGGTPGKHWEVQTRAPKGDPKGGQWAKEGGPGGSGGKIDIGQVPGGAGYQHDGKPVAKPPKPTDVENNHNSEDIASYVAGHDPGDGLNGIAFAPWDGPPRHDFSKVPNDLPHEPPWPEAVLPAFTDPKTGQFWPAEKKRLGAGVVVREPDGRVWVVEPANHFGGYRHTFPKGGIEEGLNLQQTAHKEAWEETGLQVKLTGVLGDFEGDTSIARYYTAERIGGDPSTAHWESWAVKLAPKADLPDLFNRKRDRQIAARLDEEVAKARGGGGGKKKKGGKFTMHGQGHWTLQTRAPKGSPDGGQWMAEFGSGSYGKKSALGGGPFFAVYAKGANPNNSALIAANKAILHYKESAEAGLDKFKRIPPPIVSENPNSYQLHKYANYMEAKAYAEAKTTAKAQPLEGGVETPVKLSSWQKVGGKPGGSSQGGMYKDQNGDTWLVKSYPANSKGMAEHEVLASHLYKAAGAGAPEMKLVDLEGQYQGGIGVASKWVGTAESLTGGKMHPQGKKNLAQEDFAADAWLNNWDAVGLAKDNIVVTPDLQAIRIDPGGSLEWRAMGGKKPFSTVADAFDTLRDPKMNKPAADIFGDMSNSQLKASIDKVAGVEDATIAGLVDKYGYGNVADKALLTAKLTLRRDDLIARGEKLQPTAKATLEDAAATPVPKVEVAAKVAKDNVAATAKKADVNPEILAKIEAGDNWAHVPPAYTGQSATFYKAKTAAFNKASFEAIDFGDFTEIQALAAWKPESATAQKSANYTDFKKYADDQIEWVKAQHAYDNGQKAVGPASPAAADPATPPAAHSFPPKPEIKTTPTNQNLGLKTKAAAIESTLGLYQDGTISKMAAINSIIQHKFSTNTYGKPLGQWQKDVLSSLGGHDANVKPPIAVVTEAAVVQAKVAAAAVHSVAATTGAKTVLPKTQLDALYTPPAEYKSSNPIKNKVNNEALQTMQATIKTGDLEKIDSLILPVYDLGTGAELGKVQAAAYPSGPLASWYNSQRATIHAALNPPPPPPPPSKDLHELIGQIKGAGHKDIHDAKSKGHQVLGRYTIASKMSPPDYHALSIQQIKNPNFSGYSHEPPPGSQYRVWLDKARNESHVAYNNKFTASERKALNSHNGSGYQGTSQAALSSTQHASTVTLEKAIKTKGIDLPVGLVISRKVSINQGDLSLLPQLHAGGLNGAVIQDQPAISTSFSPAFWHGNYHFKMTAGVGVKGMVTHKLAGVPLNSEPEITLAPRQRMLIKSVTKTNGKADADGFGNNSEYIVEVLLLPTSHD